MDGLRQNVSREEVARAGDPPANSDYVNFDQLVFKVSDVIFSNLKLYLEGEFKRFELPFQDLSDLKLNVSTLASIMGTKGFFTKEEFGNCFREIRESFGLVDSAGRMKGEAIMVKYNF